MFFLIACLPCGRSNVSTSFGGHLRVRIHAEVVHAGLKRGQALWHALWEMWKWNAYLNLLSRNEIAPKAHSSRTCSSPGLWPRIGLLVPALGCHTTFVGWKARLGWPEVWRHSTPISQGGRKCRFPETKQWSTHSYDVSKLSRWEPSQKKKRLKSYGRPSTYTLQEKKKNFANKK